MKLKRSRKEDRIDNDEILRAAKREGQARCREQIRSGERTSESMLALSPEAIKKIKIIHRCIGA